MKMQKVKTYHSPLEICSRCKFMLRIDATCRKRAPGENGFPKINDTDWCGEFEQRYEIVVMRFD